MPKLVNCLEHYAKKPKIKEVTKPNMSKKVIKEKHN